MSTRDPEPQTFRIPDFPREPDTAPIECAYCGVIVHDDDESVACENEGCAAVHAECALPLDEADGTWICMRHAVLVGTGKVVAS